MDLGSENITTRYEKCLEAIHKNLNSRESTNLLSQMATPNGRGILNTYASIFPPNPYLSRPHASSPVANGLLSSRPSHCP